MNSTWWKIMLKVADELHLALLKTLNVVTSLQLDARNVKCLLTLHVAISVNGDIVLLC